jgi:hypothetical protein
VPAGAKSAAVNVIALAPRSSGRLSVDSASASSTSTVSFVAGQTVGNLYVGRLSSAGTITITNRSSGTVQLVAHVTGYLR